MTAQTACARREQHDTGLEAATLGPRVIRGAVRSVAAAIFLGLAALLRRASESAQAKSKLVADMPGLAGTYVRGFLGAVAEVSLSVAVLSAAVATCLGIWAMAGLFWPAAGPQQTAEVSQ